MLNTSVLAPEQLRPQLSQGLTAQEGVLYMVQVVEHALEVPAPWHVVAHQHRDLAAVGVMEKMLYCRISYFCSRCRKWRSVMVWLIWYRYRMLPRLPRWAGTGGSGAAWPAVQSACGLTLGPFILGIYQSPLSPGG